MLPSTAFYSLTSAAPSQFLSVFLEQYVKLAARKILPLKCLDRELAEVKMPFVTSRNVCISRRRKDIIDKVTNGECFSFLRHIKDQIEWPYKFPTYFTLYSLPYSN